MDCQEYIADYLSAHADGELSASELRRAAQHLGDPSRPGCPRCSRRLAEERALKAAVRAYGASLCLPADLRERVGAALRDEAPQESSRRQRRRSWLWASTTLIPLALAASAVIFFLARRPAAPLYQPAFEMAAQAFSRFEHGFAPAVEAHNSQTLKNLYRRQVPFAVSVWDFSRLGLNPVGGRIDPSSAGVPTVFTLYRGGSVRILCAEFRQPGFKPPPGAEARVGASFFYTYRGLAFCVTPLEQGVVCILVQRTSVAQFVKQIRAVRG